MEKLWQIIHDSCGQAVRRQGSRRVHDPDIVSNLDSISITITFGIQYLTVVLVFSIEWVPYANIEVLSKCLLSDLSPYISYSFWCFQKYLITIICNKSWEFCPFSCITSSWIRFLFCSSCIIVRWVEYFSSPAFASLFTLQCRVHPCCILLSSRAPVTLPHSTWKADPCVVCVALGFL